MFKFKGFISQDIGFNPAPLMPLVEIIPAVQTSKDTLNKAKSIIDDWGKVTVIAKDTPGFIGNRIGNFGIQDLFHNMKELDLSIEDLDNLTGSLIGRPRSGCRDKHVRRA